jgi:hypothetical protein
MEGMMAGVESTLTSCKAGYIALQPKQKTQLQDMPAGACMCCQESWGGDDMRTALLYGAAGQKLGNTSNPHRYQTPRA